MKKIFADRDFDEISIDITLYLLRMDGLLEFWKNASMYLAACNRNIANSGLLISRPVVIQACG